MLEIPSEITDRLKDYCNDRGVAADKLIGYGVDGFVWRTEQNSVLKVHRHSREFERECAAYQRLKEHGIRRLRGFAIPVLLDYDTGLLVLELSFVFPPFVLDFGAASVDGPMEGVDVDSDEFREDVRRRYLHHADDVLLLIDALRLYGVYLSDIHPGNIQPLQEPDGGNS